MHLVWQGAAEGDLEEEAAGNMEDVSSFEQTNLTVVEQDDTLRVENEESFTENSPNAESTVLSSGDSNSNQEDPDESTEADRNHLSKKTKKIKIIKQTVKAVRLDKKIKSGGCCRSLLYLTALCTILYLLPSVSFVADAAEVRVSGRWVNVSD